MFSNHLDSYAVQNQFVVLLFKSKIPASPRLGKLTLSLTNTFFICNKFSNSKFVIPTPFFAPIYTTSTNILFSPIRTVKHTACIILFSSLTYAIIRIIRKICIKPYMIRLNIFHKIIYHIWNHYCLIKSDSQ